MFTETVKQAKPLLTQKKTVSEEYLKHVKDTNPHFSSVFGTSFFETVYHEKSKMEGRLVSGCTTNSDWERNALPSLPR